MVVLRLRRVGRANLPLFRLVVADSRRPVKGKVVAEVGSYNPHTKEFTFNKEEVERYLGNGAQPSNTVAKLLQKHGVTLPDWVQITERKRAPRKPVEAEEKPAKKEEATEAETAEAPEAAPEEAEVAEGSEEPAAEAAAEPAETEAAAPEEPAADKAAEPVAEAAETPSETTDQA